MLPAWTWAAGCRHRTGDWGRPTLAAPLTTLSGWAPPPALLQITFQGNGPAGSILAIADTRGNVKGKINNPAGGRGGRGGVT